MDKLTERESATRTPLTAAPALAVQFFLIPLAVIGIAFVLYVGLRSLLADNRTAPDYLAEVRNGGSNRRWPAAYELSRFDVRPEGSRRSHARAQLVKAFQESSGDPQVRRYLALAIGRLDPPFRPMQWLT